MDLSKTRGRKMDCGLTPSICDKEYLGDIIPYRCPKCGDIRTFSSLRDLKRHLELDHSYKIECVKPRARAKVFSYRVDDSKPWPSVSKSWNPRSPRDGQTAEQRNDVDRRSPLLDTFREETRRLESRVQRAKEEEVMNKMNRDVSSKSEKSDPTPYDQGNSRNIKFAISKNIKSNSLMSLNEEISRSRQNQLATGNALYQSDELLKGIEEAAERRFCDQQGLIKELAQNLRSKEHELEEANQGLEEMRAERHRLMQETQNMLKASTLGNETIKSELDRRDGLLETVNEQLHDLRSKFNESLQERDSELLLTRNQMERLEMERQKLMIDTEVLMQESERDNSVLKQTLNMKERQLQKVNLELEKLKRDKEDLIKESVTLYRTANDGNNKLKSLIQTKDWQLQDAQQQINKMKEMHGQLLQESEQLTTQADLHSQTLKKILMDKENQLAETRHQLQLLLDQGKDRPHDERRYSAEPNPPPCDSKEGNGTENHVAEMQDLLMEKESEIDMLKKFISNTAEKEAIARQKLEQFINGLINRADKAEMELQRIKSQSETSTDDRNGPKVKARGRGKEQQRMTEGGRGKPQSGGPRELKDKSHSQTKGKSPNQQEVREQGPELTSTPVAKPRGQGNKNNAKSAARSIMEDAIEPWSNSVPSPKFSADLSTIPIHPPEEFADEEEEDDFSEDYSEDADDSISVLESSEQSVGGSDLSNTSVHAVSQPHVLHFNEKPNEFGRNEADGYRRQEDDRNLTRPPKEKADKEPISLPDSHSIMSDTDLVPVKLSDTSSKSASPKKTKNILSKGKEKIRKMLHPELKNSSRKVKDTKQSDGPKRKDLNTLDMSFEHDSTSYSPLPDSLQKVYHITASPILQSSRVRRPEIKMQGKVVPKDGSCTTEKATGNVLKGKEAEKDSVCDATAEVLEKKGQSSKVKSSSPSPKHGQHVSSPKISVLRRDGKLSNSVSKNFEISEDSYLDLPVLDNGVLHTAENSKRRKSPKQNLKATASGEAILLHSSRVVSSHSGIHAALGDRDFRLDGEENSQVLPKMAPSSPLPTIHRLHSDNSSCQSMYDDSTIGEVQNDHSLCDIGSITEDDPLLEEEGTTSFDHQMDENGIIWENYANEESNYSLVNQQRFSPYGSEMNSQSSKSVQDLNDNCQLFTDAIPAYHSEDSQITYPRVQSNHVRFKDDHRSDPLHYDRRQFPHKYTFRNKQNAATLTSPRSNMSTNSSSEFRSRSGSENSSVSRLLPMSDPIVRHHYSDLQPDIRISSKSLSNLNEGYSQNLNERFSGSEISCHQMHLSQSPGKRQRDRQFDDENSYEDFQNGIAHGTKTSTLNKDFSTYAIEPVEKTRSLSTLAPASLNEMTGDYAVLRSKSAHNLVGGSFLPKVNSGNYNIQTSSGNIENVSAYRKKLPSKHISPNRLENERQRFADSVHRKLDEINQRAALKTQSVYNISPVDNGRHFEDHRSYNPVTQFGGSDMRRELPYGGEVSDKSRSMMDLRHLNRRDYVNNADAVRNGVFSQTPERTTGRSRSSQDLDQRKNEGQQGFLDYRLAHSGKDANETSVRKKAVLKDSSSQTYLLDRDLKGKSIEDLEELSSSVQQKKTEVDKIWNRNDSKSDSCASSASYKNSLGDPSINNYVESKPELLSVKKLKIQLEDNVPLSQGSIHSDHHGDGSEAANHIVGQKEMSVGEEKEVDTVSDQIQPTKAITNQCENDSKDALQTLSESSEVYSGSSGPLEDNGKSIRSAHKSSNAATSGRSSPEGKLSSASSGAKSTLTEEGKNSREEDSGSSLSLSLGDSKSSAGLNKKSLEMAREGHTMKDFKEETLKTPITSISPECDQKHQNAEQLGRGSRTRSLGSESSRSEAVDVGSEQISSMKEGARVCDNKGDKTVEPHETDKRGKFRQKSYSGDSEYSSASVSDILGPNEMYEPLVEEEPEVSDEPASTTADLGEHLDLRLRHPRGILNKSTSIEDVETLEQLELSQGQIDTAPDKSEIQQTKHEIEAPRSERAAETSAPARSYGAGRLSYDEDRPYCIEGLFAEVQETDDDSSSFLDDYRIRLTPASSIESLVEGRPISRREERRRRRRVLFNIFSFLDVETLLQVALVCREWKQVSRHPDLWKQVCIMGQKCSSKFLQNLSTWCTRTEKLSLIDLKSRDKLASETEEEYIKSIRGSLEPGLERFLQVTESSLKSIEIVNCGYLLTDKSIWTTSCYSRLLRHVKYVTNTDPLGPDVMWAFGAGCRDVTSLVIPPLYPCEKPDKFNNKCLQIISQVCVNLEVLSIGGPNIDINGLVLVAKSCQRLQQFELHYSHVIDEDTAVAVCRMGFHNLTHLRFIHTTVTPQALLHFFESCRHLRSIVVAMSISDYHDHREDVELEEIEKWCQFVQEMKELESLPRLGNILKINLQSV